MRSLCVLLGSLLLIATAADAHDVCHMISRGERLKHIGETITFAGEFGSDIERSVAWPDGCPWGVGVGKIAPDAEKIINAFQGHPAITVHGTFTGTLTRVGSNGFEFYKDDGMRLDIIRLARPSPGKRKP